MPNDAPYTVQAEGHLISGGVWRINAALRFADGLAPEPGDQLLGTARLELLQCIVREAARGRACGATQVRLRMDVAGRVSEVDLTNGTPDLLH